MWMTVCACVRVCLSHSLKLERLKCRRPYKECTHMHTRSQTNKSHALDDIRYLYVRVDIRSAQPFTIATLRAPCQCVNRKTIQKSTRWPVLSHWKIYEHNCMYKRNETGQKRKGEKRVHYDEYTHCVTVYVCVNFIIVERMFFLSRQQQKIPFN